MNSVIQLARPGDPLVMPDGMILQDPKARVSRIRQQISSANDPATFRPGVQRAVKELPAPPQQMNAIAVVFVYTMLGIGSREIAEVLHITTVELDQIRTHSAYGELFEAVKKEFINVDSEFLQQRIAGYAHAALDTVARLATESESEGIQFKAADSLLTRNERASTKERNGLNDLRIVVVNGEQSVSIDVNGNAVNI